MSFSTYETKIVCDWINSDETLYNFIMDMVKEEKPVHEIAKQIKEFFWEAIPINTADVFTDLLNNALQEVDWQELTETFIER